MSLWRRVRSLFPVTEVGVYLDHAGAAPVSSWVEEAVRQFVETAARRGGNDHHAKVSLELERVRGRVAALVSAQPTEIAFVADAERGLERVAGDIDWHRGDLIVVASDEVPPAWKNLAQCGVEIHRVPLDAGAIIVSAVITDLQEQAERMRR